MKEGNLKTVILKMEKPKKSSLSEAKVATANAEINKIKDNAEKAISAILKRAAKEMRKVKGQRVKVNGRNWTITGITPPTKYHYDGNLALKSNSTTRNAENWGIEDVD